jgi:hypothetical protein
VSSADSAPTARSMGVLLESNIMTMKKNARLERRSDKKITMGNRCTSSYFSEAKGGI